MDTIRACDCRNSAALERFADKAMCIDKLTVEAGAGVVLLRKCKKEFARADRTGVNGKTGNLPLNLVVKHRGANTTRLGAHQSCCLSNVHVITASSRSSSCAVAGAGDSSSNSVFGGRYCARRVER